MESDGPYETYYVGEEEPPGDFIYVEDGEVDNEEATVGSESSESEDSEPEDSGYSYNENGSQELTLLDGPSVLIQPILDDEGDDDGRYINNVLYSFTI